MNDLLNPYQKASLAIVLRMFEEDLRLADSWLDGRQAEGILYSRQLHLMPPQRATARGRITAALDEIAALAEKLGLEQEVENPDGLILSKMSIAWANLLDSQANKLQRYGDVSPDAAAVIDPPIQRLAQSALELALLFENRSSTPASPDAENLTDL
jgi:hypothetical protein